MSTFKDKGIVLREINKGESDKSLILLLKERGKLLVSVKGARNAKSKYQSGSQLFCYSEFVVFEGNGFYSVTQINLLDNFFNLRNDYDKFLLSASFLKTVDKIMYPQMPSKDVLFLLVKTLKEMSRDIIPKELVSIVFYIKLLQLEGFQPSLQACGNCGKKYIDEFYFCENGVICKNCLNYFEKSYRIYDPAVIYTVSYILNCKISELYKFTISDKIMNELKIIVNFLIEKNFLNRH